MLRRLAKDERGMAMPLAIFMVVLVGVMGAGLLTFASTDLNTVIEVNRGQKAFEIADAGVQYAKRQLRSDVIRQHYDADYTNDCANGNNRMGPDWSPTTTGYPNSNCTGTPTSKAAGVSKNFAGGKFTVTIQCFDQTGDPSDICSGISENAPESVAATRKVFLKVISTGYYPADGSGAKRRIEAIYNTTADPGTPRAFFTRSELQPAISIGGSACVKNVSLFTLGGVDFDGGGECTLPGGGKTHIQGTDFAYKSWATNANSAISYPNDYNSTPRPTGEAGVGAVKQITDDSTGSLRYRDFDSTTNPITFIKKDPPTAPQLPSQMSFPFDYTSQIGTQDTEQINFWREEALRQEAETGQDHYMELSGSNPNLTSWPNSSPNTVVFVKLLNAGTDLIWDVGSSSDPDLPSPPYPNHCKSPIREGVLVVEGGNFRMNPNEQLLEGAVIIRGGQLVSGDGDFVATGNVCLQAVANAEDDIKINGAVNAAGTPDLANSPGFYNVKLWSWRELYE